MRASLATQRRTHLSPSRSARIGRSWRKIDARDAFVTRFGEVDDVKIEVVVPLPVEVPGRVDERDALFLGQEPDDAIVGGVGGDDVVDRLEHRAVEVLDLARTVLVDRHARVRERDADAVGARERDQLAIGLGVAALHQFGVRHRRKRRRLRLGRIAASPVVGRALNRQRPRGR